MLLIICNAKDDPSNIQLLKKEESLSRAEQELEARAQELTHARAELQEARSESSGLRKDLQDLQQQFLELQAHRYGAEDFRGAVDVFPLYFYLMLISVSLEEFIYVAT